MSFPALSDKLSLLPKYQIECEDPYHRHFETLQGPLELYRQRAQTVDFWNFLEQPEVKAQFPNTARPEYRMLWLNTEQRKEYAARFIKLDNGNWTIATPKDGQLADGKWIFTFKQSGCYVAREIRHQLHHDSLVAGENVAFPGIFVLKNGCVSGISFSSGHYCPTIVDGMPVLQLLDEQGFSVKNLKFKVVHKNEVLRGVDFDTLRRLALEEAPIVAQEKKMAKTAKAREPFLIPLNNGHLPDEEKVMLFITESGRGFVGTEEMKANHPLCKELGEPIVDAIKARVAEGQISKVILKNKIEIPGEVEKAQASLARLEQAGIRTEGLGVRVLDANGELDTKYLNKTFVKKKKAV